VNHQDLGTRHDDPTPHLVFLELIDPGRERPIDHGKPCLSGDDEARVQLGHEQLEHTPDPSSKV
jgi:hypothetical protein